MKDKKPQIEMISVQKLIPYAKNPRKNDEAIAGVMASIKEFGFQNPIIIDKENVIIAGHTRLAAAQRLELKEVPCLRADGLSEAQIKAYRLLDNKLAEKAEWEPELLEMELSELEEFSFDLEPFEVAFSLKGQNNPYDEWKGLPEYEQEDTGFQRIMVHLKDESAREEFSKLVKQQITEKTKAIHFPEQKPLDLENYIVIDEE